MIPDKSDHSASYLCAGPERHAWPTAEDAAKCCNGYRRARRIRPTESDNPSFDFYWEPIAASVARPEDAERAHVVDVIRPTPYEALPEAAEEHAVFLDRLSALVSPTDPRSYQLRAGLATLRLVDRWMLRNVSGRDTMAQEHLEVRRAIAEVSDERARSVLLQLLQTARAIDSDDGASLSVVMLSYAALLEDNAEWRVAIEVYRTASKYSVEVDRGGLPLVYNRIGYCHRQLGELDAAAAVYREGQRVATDLDQSSDVLSLQNCEGVLALHRGNIPEAVRILDSVIEEAAAGNHRQVFAQALHDRGAVAIKQGGYELAALYFDRALRSYDDVVCKERALEDLADALYLVGAHEAARDALLINSLTAVQRDVRAHAAVCLMRLAVDQGDELMFESYRNAMPAIETLPTHMQAQVHRQIAISYGAFGRRAKADDHFHTLLRIAEESGLNEYIVDAEEGLKGRFVETSRSTPTVTLSSSLTSVATRLRECRDALATTASR